MNIKTDQAEGVYSFADNSFEGSMSFSSAGGLAMDMDGLRELARSQRSKQMWACFVPAVLLGVTGANLLKKKE